MANKKEFSSAIIAWYLDNKRNLPWRNTKDPYKIWLSEVILQQTRVVQGLPYYTNFIHKFPTVKDLALTDEQEVLRTWQGLGYYSRARNLHKCAKIVHEEMDNQFPSSYQGLLKLPGVGRYTAAAIASFCYREKVAVVDGNVYRVLARVYGIEDDIASNNGQKKFHDLANILISSDQPDLYNQGIMEFGAMHCTPKAPKCEECLFMDTCQAFEKKLQSTLPIKTKKAKTRIRHFNYICIVRKKELLMKKRGPGDIWQGLYDFPLVETSSSIELENLFEEANWLDKTAISEIDESIEYTHILSHQKIKAKFFTLHINKEIEQNGQPDMDYFSLSEVLDLPKPVLISHYLNAVHF